jgi:hypothetical protein
MIRNYLTPIAILAFVFLFSGNAYAKEDVLRCALKNKLNEPDIRTEVEIDLDKKILWADGSKYKINLIGERAIKAESENGNVRISIDRFDGFMTLEALSSKFGGYCKKYKKIF